MENGNLQKVGHGWIAQEASEKSKIAQIMLKLKQ